MKKALCMILFLSSFFILFAKEKMNSEKFVQVKGIVHMYGNMPFSFPGIETEDGEIYTLKADNPKTEKKISELTGRKVLVKGVVDYPVSENGEKILLFQMLDDGFLWVDEIKKVRY